MSLFLTVCAWPFGIFSIIGIVAAWSNFDDAISTREKNASANQVAWFFFAAVLCVAWLVSYYAGAIR